MDGWIVVAIESQPLVSGFWLACQDWGFFCLRTKKKAVEERNEAMASKISLHSQSKQETRADGRQRKDPTASVWGGEEVLLKYGVRSTDRGGTEEGGSDEWGKKENRRLITEYTFRGSGGGLGLKKGICNVAV